MDFSTLFTKSVHADKFINPEATADCLIPNTYDYSGFPASGSRCLSDYFHLLAGGNNHADFPFAYSFAPLNCFFILYTVRGRGEILRSRHTFPADEHHLVLLDCRQHYTLRSSLLPWDFRLFFFTGADMRLFDAVLNPVTGSCFSLPEFSMIQEALTALLSIPEHPDLSEIIKMHQIFTGILSELCLSALPGSQKGYTPPAPSYLIELHDHLDRHYAEEFSLIYFEDLLKINRYRLCREFSETYGMPPLKYLTNKRLEEAKKMLLTTDWTIHEISSKTGYNNVNNFIKLFKKYIGTTPGVFRQTHQICVPESMN